MNAIEAKVGTQYLSMKGVPVVMVGVKDEQVLLEVTINGNIVKVAKDYKLKVYVPSQVCNEARALLKAEKPSIAGTPEAKKRMATARSERKAPIGPSIGATAVACIKKGLNFEDTLKEVKKVRPDCQMKMASYNWYKAKIKKGVL